MKLVGRSSLKENKQRIMQQIIDEIHAHIVSCGGGRSDWYIGITNDPRTCLFSRHGVEEHAGHWIYRDTGDETAARAIEKVFLDWGAKGSGGGGDMKTQYVYAYRITNYTRE